MTAFIDDHRAEYGVEPICRTLQVAPSGYHERVAQRRNPARRSVRARKDDALKPDILRIFAENFNVYGARKVWRQMQREGFKVARCTVERLMADRKRCSQPTSVHGMSWPTLFAGWPLASLVRVLVSQV
ncbi:helix-turn-helix protein [Novosphingobium sp. GV055]|nr:helix-turn-helix protein [Novosphingobium sp. GV055]PUB01653.1 helix-turn-helix protein [Novosphingobium sp. GV061]PUB17625.1 helix-turn-helix protein [Novosphingobium sp. GV079]PUB40319.1 helix-turn-helix protein [Novosphingobium sp. GV027]